MQGWNIFLVVSPYPRLLSEWTILCWNFFGAQNTERTPVTRTSGFQFHFRFHYSELVNIVYIIIAVATKSYEYFNWWLWCWNLGEASTLDIYIIYTLDCGYSSELQSLQLRSILQLEDCIVQVIFKFYLFFHCSEDSFVDQNSLSILNNLERHSGNKSYNHKSQMNKKYFHQEYFKTKLATLQKLKEQLWLKLIQLQFAVVVIVIISRYSW